MLTIARTHHTAERPVETAGMGDPGGVALLPRHHHLAAHVVLPRRVGPHGVRADLGHGGRPGGGIEPGERVLQMLANSAGRQAELACDRGVVVARSDQAEQLALAPGKQPFGVAAALAAQGIRDVRLKEDRGGPVLRAERAASGETKEAPSHDQGKKENPMSMSVGDLTAGRKPVNWVTYDRRRVCGGSAGSPVQ